MIPIFVNLQTSRNSSNAASYDTNSLSFGAGLIVVDVNSTTGTGPIETPTLSGLGLTWSQAATVTRATDTQRLTRFYALATEGGIGAITIDFDAQVQTHCDWSITQVNDCLLTGTNGVDAFVQAKADTSGSSASSHSVTFNATWDHADNRALAAFTHSSGSASFVAGTGFTMLGQAVGSGPNSGIGTEHGRDSDDAVDMSSSGSLNWKAIISEIAGASDTPPPSEDIVLRRVRRRGLNARIN